MDPGQDQRHKTHNDPHSGRKADKKRKKKNVNELSKDETKERKRNPKAFAIQSAVKAERQFRHKQDKLEKKYHIPTVDRSPVEPPPIIVAVVGPAQVGKSTLIRNLVKHFTGQTVNQIQGPITVIAGKNKRFTFIECNNDINNMIDLAKIADISLLLVDASFGFEMETFEYLNVCKAHGEHRIMGVLTHLDQFNKFSRMKKAKKDLRKRFWTEVYAGAKLFYLSRIASGNEYVKMEVRNLARFLTVMKLQPVPFRTLHPYMLVDRFEDLTNPDEIRLNERCDRNVILYGYSRGAYFKPNQPIHLAGCGDMRIDAISFLPDPCPLPEGGGRRPKGQSLDELAPPKKRKMLTQKEKLVYAPFSGLGGILYDQDAVYIDLGTSHFHKDQTINPVFEEMNREKLTMDSKIKESTVQLFSSHQGHDDDHHHRREDDDQDMDSADEMDDNDDGDDGDNHDDDDDDDNSGDEELSEADFDEQEDEDEGGEDDDDQEDDQDEEQAFRRLKKSVGDGDEKDQDSENDRYSFDDDSDEEDVEGSTAAAAAVGTLGNGDHQKDQTLIKSDDLALKWKDNLAKKAAESYYKHQQTTADVQKLVYGEAFDLKDENELPTEEEEDEELVKFYSYKKDETDKLHKMPKQPEYKFTLNNVESTQFVLEQRQNWSDPNVLKEIRDCFVTGKWSHHENADMILKDDEQEMEDYGDFDDLENEANEGQLNDADNDDDDDEDDEDDDQFDDDQIDDEEKKDRQMRLEKKKQLKEQFDAKYDNRSGNSKTKEEGEEEEEDGKNEKDDQADSKFYREIKEKLARQAQLNRSEFEGVSDHVRVQFEGYRPGMYIRIQLKSMPHEFVNNFDPNYPVIVGGLLSGETNTGFIQVRIKKHRWYPKILKSRNPLIISLGWRRFQTMPIYSMQDHNGRDRCLKYTPLHLHCYASFFGPITPQGTGFVAFQDSSEFTNRFRLAATGTVLNLDRTLNLVKKLKLIGQPMRIHKKTAFIRGMFNSSLEAAKFEGALIKTVSGIRGHIKKSVSKPEGSFRATFEDKIVLSDLVFLRTWYTIDIPQFYYPVPNLLLDSQQKQKWKGMKTVGQLRHEQGVSVEQKKDSFYQIMERKKFTFKPLQVPKTLGQQLPFRNKQKYLPKKQNKVKRVAVVREPEEQKIATLQKRIRAMYKDNERIERQQVVDKNRKKGQENVKRLAKQKESLKRKKKAICKKISMNRRN